MFAIIINTFEVVFDSNIYYLVNKLIEIENK